MIHHTAIVSKNAEVEKEVSIGPYCVIEGNVKIQKGTELVSHVNISGNTHIGKNNKFFLSPCYSINRFIVFLVLNVIKFIYI